MLKYGLYARKSDKDRDEVIKSNEDQKSVCLDVAHRYALPIKRTYEENKTAKIPGVRPVYKQMVADLKSGAINAVLVYHVNRLARNMEEAGALAQMLIDGKIQEIRTPHVAYRPGDNILPLLLEQGMSTQQSLELSERVTLAVRERAAAGDWPHRAPLGYLNVRHPLNPKRGQIALDPHRHLLVRRMFDLMLTGAYSVKQVVDIANDEWGLRTRASYQRPERTLHYSTAYNIFTNPYYAGIVVHKGEQFKGTHPPLLSLEEFQRIQHILSSRGHIRTRKHSFAYNGLIFCGYCGQQVCGEQHHKSGKLRIYYHCADTFRRCTKRGISEEKLEQQIMDALTSITIEPALGEIVLERLLHSEAEFQHRSSEDTKRQQRALAEVEEKRKRLLDLMLSGLLTDEASFKSKEAELLAERNRLLLALQHSQENQGRTEATLRGGLSFMQQARERFVTADPETKKMIVGALVRQFTLRENTLSMEIEPLLRVLITFSHEVEGALEPDTMSSESAFSTPFFPAVQFGGPNELVLEPNEELIEIGRTSDFRNPLDQLDIHLG